MICGFARAGKDTFAKGIMSGAVNNTYRMAFASPLKDALRMSARELGVDVDYRREVEKLQDRDLLVEFGRAMRRRDKDIFAKAVSGQLETLWESHTCLITDWRYLNEYMVIKEACDRLAINLHTVRIVRHGWKAANEEEAMSLQEIMMAVPFDETIYATSGDEEAVLLHGFRTAKLWHL
jgi:hypothetical protein